MASSCNDAFSLNTIKQPNTNLINKKEILYYNSDSHTYLTKHLCENIGDGTFDYVNDKTDRIILKNAWVAITETKTWDFVAENNESFILSKDPQIYVIIKKMEKLGYDGHSGCSFGCTMRNMQYLAKNGVDKFKKLF